MSDKNIMSYETVALDDEQSALVIIDQTKLPYEVEILHLTQQKDIWNAIYLLQVRGAPAIGVAAGFGVRQITRHAIHRRVVKHIHHHLVVGTKQFEGGANRANGLGAGRQRKAAEQQRGK